MIYYECADSVAGRINDDGGEGGSEPALILRREVSVLSGYIFVLVSHAGVTGGVTFALPTRLCLGACGSLI